jgi:hypothetical protein
MTLEPWLNDATALVIVLAAELARLLADQNVTAWAAASVRERAQELA